MGLTPRDYEKWRSWHLDILKLPRWLQYVAKIKTSALCIMVIKESLVICLIWFTDARQTVLERVIAFLSNFNDNYIFSGIKWFLYRYQHMLWFWRTGQRDSPVIIKYGHEICISWWNAAYRPTSDDSLWASWINPRFPERISGLRTPRLCYWQVEWPWASHFICSELHILLYSGED